MKSMPMVDIKVVLKASSENLRTQTLNNDMTRNYYFSLYLKRMHVFPTPESPIRRSLKRRS